MCSLSSSCCTSHVSIAGFIAAVCWSRRGLEFSLQLEGSEIAVYQPEAPVSWQVLKFTKENPLKFFVASRKTHKYQTALCDVCNPPIPTPTSATSITGEAGQESDKCDLSKTRKEGALIHKQYGFAVPRSINRMR